MAWALGLFAVLILVLPPCLRCELEAQWRQDKLYASLRLLGLRLPLTGRNKFAKSGTSYPKNKRPEAALWLSYGELLLRLLPRAAEKLRLE